MDNHPIENLMRTTMENIKNMIDVNTVIGNPVTSPDGTTIIPVSKVSFGFASGGSEFKDGPVDANYKYPFAGGSGAGISLKPVGFLVVHDTSVRFLSVDDTDSIGRLIDLVPQAVDFITGLFKKDDKKTEEEPSPEEFDDM